MGVDIYLDEVEKELSNMGIDINDFNLVEEKESTLNNKKKKDKPLPKDENK